MTQVIDFRTHRLMAAGAGHRGGPRATAISRPRLEHLADEVALAAVFAPAGYGKTSLLRAWEARWLGAGTTPVWFILGEADRSPAHLRARLEAALPADTAPPRALLIDEAQVLRGAPAEAELRRFLDGRRAGDRIAIAGRGRLDLGLAKRALVEPIVMLGAAQLAFELEELDDVLTLAGGEPARDAARQLMHATEGWPAAVAMAGGALAGGELEATRLMSRLPRPWPALRAYLQEEVLAPLAPGLAAFLLEAGVLGRFSAALADRVVGTTEAAAMMRDIKALGLPLGRDPDDESRLNVHPLLAAFLDERLSAERPERRRELHQAAAHWYAEQGLLGDAVRSAFASNDGVFAGELLARASAERRRIGRFRAFAGWTSQLPPQVFERHPTLRLEAACAHAALFEHEAARLYADPVRLQYEDLSPTARDDLHAVDAIIAIYGDRPDAALEAGQRGLRALAGMDPYTVGTLRLATAFGWLAKGAHEAARHALIKARADHEQARSAFGTACALALSGLSHAIQGRLPAAAADWREADKAICSLDTSEIVESIAIGYLPETLYEWNDIAGAEDGLRRCLASSMEVALPDMVACLFVTAARVAMARGEPSRAAEILDAAEVAAHRRDWPRLGHVVAWERVRLALQRGAVGEARQLHAQIQAEGGFAEIPGYLPHCAETEADLVGPLRLELVTHPSRALLSKLRAAIGQANAQGRVWRMVRLLILEARAHNALDNRPAALRTLRRALEQAAPGRMVRSFVDEGTEVLGMIETILLEERRAPLTLSVPYLEQILAAAGRTAEAPPEPRGETASLSRRERDVLKMLSAGLSNLEIGERLFVSQHTVKWHLQHIYEKLGVRSRTQAVASARASGLTEA